MEMLWTDIKSKNSNMNQNKKESKYSNRNSGTDRLRLTRILRKHWKMKMKVKNRLWDKTRWKKTNPL